MKAFAVCIIAGAAAAVAVWILYQEQPAAPAADTPAAEHPSDSAVTPAHHSLEARDAGAPAREPDRVAALPAASKAAEPAQEDWDAPCECGAGRLTRKLEREKAAREAESKDINWAYEMEQLLGQFIAAHPRATTIQVSGIECRTSFCEIKAIGQADSWEAFIAIVEQTPNEPWSTLSLNKRMSSDFRDDGQMDFHAIIERTSASTTGSAGDHLLSPALSVDEDECECATEEWQARKAEFEAAARAAEPKDANWAYATEQRLQQFIAADPRSTTFEISSMDCRTTFCEIKAIGQTEQSSDDFSDIIYQAVAQERFGLAQEMMSGASRYDGRVDLGARVRRKR